MPVKIEPNAEPIPGYRLIERLGGGGFGEVWKAEAPGGLLKAIKFVYGDLYAADDADGSRAEQELKALSRVKTVRHAYILSIERFDIIDGHLIIITELADRTLWDRFRECQKEGLPGLPREELLGYMEETAEALDLMNEQFQLQHLDIKPQNLFLVHNHIKVADFGLAKDMGDKANVTMTGGVTPVYAAPETFDGWLSRFSDQYSLAIVYQEILTGERPFTGSTMRQLVLQHLQTPPNLTSLPVADRPVIGRALNKNPDERYPTCHEFVKALRSATITSGARSAPLPALPSSHAPRNGPVTEKVAAVPNDAGDVGQVTQGARSSNTPRPSEAPAALEQGPSLENRLQVLPPRPGTQKDNPNDVSAASEAAGGTILNTALGHRLGAHVAAPRPDAEPGKGILQPALILGLGKLGLDTLQQVRKLVTQEFGHADALPHIRLLGMDTDPDAIQAAGHGDPETLLRNYEMLLAKLHRPSHYLKTRDGKTSSYPWFNSKLLYRIPRQQTGAGLRPLGRLAFVDNYRLISRRLEGELQSCAADDTLHEMARQTDLGLRSKVPRVYVVTCLGGATGGAIFIDTAYLLRHLLRKQGFPNAEVVGILLLPPATRDGQRSAALAHTYAALTELNYYSSGQMFSARYDTTESSPGSRPFTEAGPPFQRCLLINLPERTNAADETNEVIGQAAQLLYRDLATALGPALDEARRPYQQAYHMVGQALFQTFGMYRLLWPRRRLLNQSGRNLCKRLVERWMTKDVKAISEEVRNWSLERWESLEMRRENLIASHQERCEQLLGQSPDAIFQEIISPVTGVMSKGKVPDPAPGEINMGAVVQAMDQLEKLLGLPEECRPPGPQVAEPGAIEKALGEASEGVAAECEQKMLEVIAQLIEQPCYRLAGAEEALRQFCQTVEQALQAQEPLAKELHDRSVLVHQRIQVFLETPPVQEETRTTSLWKFGRRAASDKNNPADELVGLLKAFAKCRYHSLTLFHVNRLYVSLRGYLSDQIREVGFCRTRLGELAGLFTSGTQDPKRSSTAREQYLLPEGCTKVEEAIRGMDKQVGLDELAAFDERIQALIQRDYRALVEVCTGPSQVVKNLAPAMLAEAEDFLEPFVQGASVADLFIKQKGGKDGDPRNELLEAYDEAAPELGKATAGKEICVVIVPDDEAGAELTDGLGDVLPGIKVVKTDRKDEIIFYREQLQLTGTDLEQLGASAEEAYQQRASQDPGTLHCREDVLEWQTALSPCGAAAPHK
jgi:serine/threonine protein kinase